MRVFVTGATGFIGTAIVSELINAGHTVVGLARSDASAAALHVAGATAHRGSLDDLGSLHRAASDADAVIHAAFIHDFSKFAENVEIDKRAINALGTALEGSKRPLIVTSGTALTAAGHLSLESDAPVCTTNLRVGTEHAVASIAARGVNVSVLRLPPSVHGEGDHGFVPLLINIAREKGVSAYQGNGLNRWPAVHRLDAARLFRLAIEKSTAGAVYHGNAEEGVLFRDIATVIGQRLNIPVVSKSTDEMAAHFGWFAHFAALDNPTSSKRTSELLDWQPAQPGLIADIDHERYFAR